MISSSISLCFAFVSVLRICHMIQFLLLILSYVTHTYLGIASPESDSWDDKTAQRRLLSKGDTFFVPPGNIYRY